MTSPVRTSSTTPAAAFALNLSRAATSSSRSACWTRRSTDSVDRLLLAVGREAGAVQIGEPCAVEPLLDAGDALVVDVDVAEDDARPPARSDRRACSRSGSRRPECRAGGSSACCFGVISRLSQTKPRLLPSRSRSSVASRSGITAVRQLDRLVDVDDAARLGEQRRRLHVGREDLAVAVENVGARGRDRVAGAAAPGRVAVRRDREDHQLRRR